MTSAHNPLPHSCSNRPAVYILDAANSVEEKLLRDWLQQQAPHQHSEKGTHLLRWNLEEEPKSSQLTALEALLGSGDDAVITPLRVVWLPSPDFIGSGPRLHHLLLGNPRRPGALTARYILRRFPERVCCIAGEPETIHNLAEQYKYRLQSNPKQTPDAFAGFVARQGGLALDIAERRLQGGRYKVPRFIMASLSESPAYKAALEKIAERDQTSLNETWKKSRIYMKEMISLPSRFYLDVFSRFNNFLLKLGYERDLVVDPAAIEQLRTVVRQHPSILLFTHKTYLDGAVLPKVLYDNDFPLCHVFGGANMNFAGFGFLLRRAGGIFIRRSFQDNELYKLTLRHYIGYLMEKRFPLSWAFEGTRSRLGKLMPPRYGLLKYVLDACHTTEAENIHIVPISISFDLIHDVEEYSLEQAGRIKKPESLRWYLGYIRGLRKPMGRVYMDVGDPVVLAKAPQPDDRPALHKIAFQVAVEANRVTPITLPALLTFSLLGATPRALTKTELKSELLLLINWAKDRNIRLSSDLDIDNISHLRQLLDHMLAEKLIAKYDEGPDEVYGITPEQHRVASYYRNTIIHFFVNKAIIELALLKTCDAAGDGLEQEFWEEVDQLRDLFKFEFFYSPSTEFRQEIIRELDSTHPQWKSLLQGDKACRQQLLDALQPLVGHTVLLQYVEAYKIVADLIVQQPTERPLEEKVIIATALKHGRQAYLQRRISSNASIGKILFQNCFRLLTNMGLTGSNHKEAEQPRRRIARRLQELALRLETSQVIANAFRDAQFRN
jgi:glycerol-3-phosphate O-acyltransferase